MGLGCQPCEAFGPGAPSSPIDGALWVDDSTGPPYQLWRWNLGAGAWEKVGATTTVGGGGAQGFLVPINAPPLAATWTWVNQGAATRTDTPPGLIVATTGTSSNITALVQTSPATPWTRALAFGAVYDGTAPTGAGFCYRNSGSGLLELHGWNQDSGGVHEYWNSATSFNSSPAGSVVLRNARTALGLNWIRCGDDGTNRTIDVSADGQTWLRLFTVARTNFLTADQHGVWVRSAGASRLSVVSWT